MSINITMPALSPTMEEGTLAKWHVKEGDSVSSGDVIAEIETDKATMEVEAVDEGTIGKILVPEGSEGVKVNAVIAVLLQEGEDASDVKTVSSSGAGAPPSSKKGNEKAGGPLEVYAAVGHASDTKPVGEKRPGGKPADTAPPKVAVQPAKSLPQAREGESRTFASPLARRLAREAGIDVSALGGSGPRGRVIKADVEKAKKEGVPQKAPSGAPAGAAMAKGMGAADVRALYEEGTYDAVPNDGMRKVVAARLTEAARNIPHFFLTVDCRIDALLGAREAINALAPKDEAGKPQFKLSVNDFIIKAWALALQRVPKANATWAGDSILYHKRSDVAVAVAVPGGLFTPVVRSADTKPLRQISEDVRDFATRAKSKKLAPHEYQGGSSAVSNLGMYGIKHFTSIINPPHGTIIAVGAGEERVYADKGAVKTGTFMTVTLSCDHRSVDGALGAELLGVFKSLIENPVTMLA